MPRQVKSQAKNKVKAKTGGGVGNIQRYYNPNYPLYPESMMPSTFVSTGNSPGPDATSNNLYPYTSYSGGVDNIRTSNLAGGVNTTTTINPGAKQCNAPCTTTTTFAGGAKVAPKRSNARKGKLTRRNNLTKGTASRSLRNKRK
tara:strand:+ start:1194 stop:1625 length:432 start_codon:yes stop_codon:yes gene_type:complete